MSWKHAHLTHRQAMGCTRLPDERVDPRYAASIILRLHEFLGPANRGCADQGASRIFGSRVAKRTRDGAMSPDLGSKELAHTGGSVGHAEQALRHRI